MRKLILLAMVAMVATIAGGLFEPGESAKAAGPICAVPTDYSTIQAAVDEPSCTTINVASGIYAGNINVTRSVTIIGDPGDASPGPGAGAPVVDGNSLPGDAFKIANGVSNVTISGFEIRNFTSPLLNGIGNGVSAWVGSTSNITIQDNYFHDLGYNGVLVGNDWNSDSAKWGDHTGWTIKANVIESFGYIGFELTNTSSSSIEDNVIHMSSQYIGAIFSSARRSETDLAIKNNFIDGTASAVFPTIYIYAYDLDMPNPNLNGLSIQGNTIASTGTTKHVYIRDIGTGTVTGVQVNNNDLSSLRNSTSATVDGTCNWWGSASGPVLNQYPGLGTGDVTPWLTSSDLNGPCRGGLVITKNQCKNGGWATFFPAALFKNQGDCVSFVATKGKN